jgi:hypothetical protein
MKHTFALAAVLAIGLATSASASVTIASDTGASESGLGAYVATLDYDSTTFKLTIDIENTSPAANTGFLTAFVLNSPTTDITGVTLSSAPANFGLLGLATDGVNGQPFGYFDFGASTGGGFQGGGDPKDGLGVGASGSFVFSFTGSNLGSLTTQDFIDAYSKLKNEDGEKDAQFFVARFRGFKNGGSDKVPATVEVVPETGSLIVWSCLAAAGIPGMVWYRRRR